MSVEKVISKIDKCVNYEMLFCLEEDFNTIGLTLQPTKQNKMVLCIIKDGIPSANRIFEDYVHIGSLEDRSKEISLRLIDCIKEFIVEHAGVASIPINDGRSWQKIQNGLYGDFVEDSLIAQIAEQVQEEPIIGSASYHKWWDSDRKIDDISERIDLPAHSDGEID